MNNYTKVSRKHLNEDRIAICPILGCETIKKIKPLKFGFLGLGRNPICKQHKLGLVYITERIGEFIEGALSCLFDISGLPPNEIVKLVLSKYPGNYNSFIKAWIYCITIGRGATVISRYMDAISNAYLKQLTKKQIKSLKKDRNIKFNKLQTEIKRGMDEIIKQYTRLLKCLRTHSEVLTDIQELKPISRELNDDLLLWSKRASNDLVKITTSDTKEIQNLRSLKDLYDRILNLGICRCLLGLSPEGSCSRRVQITSFDIFSAYIDFFQEGLTKKFTKYEVDSLLMLSSKERLELNNLNIVSRIQPNKKIDLKLDDKDLQSFLDFYTKEFNHYFSKRFKNLDIHNHLVHDKAT